MYIPVNNREIVGMNTVEHMSVQMEKEQEDEEEEQYPPDGSSTHHNQIVIF